MPCVMIQQLMLVHTLWFLCNLKDANEHNGLRLFLVLTVLQTGSASGELEWDQNQAFCYNRSTRLQVSKVLSTHFG